MAEKGWIKLHRQLQECPMWYSERFSKGQAWVDLLLLANHSDKKILFNGEFIIVERGQYLTSMVKLAEKWKWSRPTVTKFLNLLEKDKMITRSSDNQKTLITIENYGIYQDFKEDDLQPILQPTLQPSLLPNLQLDLQPTLQGGCNPINNPLYTNNNDKNVNNVKNEKNTTIPQGDSTTQKKKTTEEKHKYGEYQHVLLTDRQFERLVNDYGEFEVQSAIKFLDEYIQMKGYKVKDHNLALRKWVFKAVKREQVEKNKQFVVNGERDLVNEWRNS